MKKIFVIALMAVGTAVCHGQQKTIDERVSDALKQMTLEEKVRLSYAQSKFSTPGVARLGIPELYYDDGPHGVREELEWNTWSHAGWTNDAVTAFPALSCLAATWNPELARQYGMALGEEARYRKKNVMLGPGINLLRTPMNGRNFEYLGEDPMLTGDLAAEYIIGLQSKGVAACLKHYALNNQEEHRGDIDVHVSERALYELYLRSFQRVIEKSNPWSIMGSYNRVWGYHACHNDRLLNKILRDEFGFKGAVVTDWGGAHDTREAVFNGLDIEMGTYTNGLTTEGHGFGYDDYYLGKAYLEMCRKGEVPESIINERAARILRLIFLTNDMSKGFGSLNSEAHLQVARKVGQEGIVLMKNDKRKDGALLPIDTKKYKHILVVGNNATRDLCAGGGSSELKAKDYVTPLRGLKERFGADCAISYAKGYEVGRASYDRHDKISQHLQDSLHDEAVRMAQDADLVIFVGGLNKNNGQDCEGRDRVSFNLSYGQDQLIEDLLRVQPKFVAVMLTGNPYAMPWLSKVPALLQAWYLGSETGHALADVMSGDVCPSGKLPFTFAPALGDYPAHRFGERSYPGIKGTPSHYKGERNATEQWYEEGVFVGYRWFDTKNAPVLYPFGHGLSYTTFEYGKAKVTVLDNKNVEISLRIKNTGTVSGKETVQVYVGEAKPGKDNPKKELRGYAKVELSAGEERDVVITVPANELRHYDEATAQWKSDSGKLKAYVGSSSLDIRQTVPFLF